jgi:HSP20 family protein
MTNIVKRGFDRLPGIFARDALDDMFETLMFSPAKASFDVEKLFGAPMGYPTNIIRTIDKNGNETGYEIDVALAGIPKENIDIFIEDDCLSISVNKVENKEEKGRDFLHRGISQRSMKLRYGLHGIDRDKIESSLVDGMLKVKLPIAEEAKPKKIKIG